MIWVIIAGVIAMAMNAHAETGPLMTDADMFKALNIDHPGLEQVKTAVAQQNLSAAKKALAEYYRTREKPVWRSDAATGGRGGRFGAGSAGFQRRLEETLDRQFTVVGVPHRFGAGNDIDWAYNPTGGDSGIEFQREWTWQFNRHGTWSLLGSAYRTTGEETYAREWAYQVSRWMRTCPRPLEGNVNGIGSRWRTIEAGIRMGGSWPVAFYNFRQSPSVSDDVLLDMVKTFAEHAYHLMPENRFSPGSNWGAMESNGLFTVGLLFPEFKEAETWRNTAMARLYDELDRQVYPDGMQIELASSYHQVSLRNFIGPLELAHINDYALPADYLAKLERMYDYNLFAAMPDGYLPQFNDSGRSNAIPAGHSLPIKHVEAIQAGAETIAARIIFANGQMHHVAIGDKPGRKTFAGFETDGEAAWIAQDATGNAIRTIVAKGNSLKRDGKQIGQMSNR